MSTTAQEALSRVVSGHSLSNYPAIYAGFESKGIPASDIKPRENIFTFNAWLALGRAVRKGEHGVRVFSFVPMTRRSETGELVNIGKRPRAVTVFHVSQTEPVAPAGSHRAATFAAGAL